MAQIPYLQVRSKSLISYSQAEDTGRFIRSIAQKKSAERLIQKEFIAECQQNTFEFDSIDITHARAKGIAWAEKRGYHGPVTVTEKKKTYTGLLCPGAKKRLTKAIEQIVLMAKPKQFFHQPTGHTVKFKLNFITLTFACSRVIRSKEAQKTCLQPFLLWLDRKHHCTMYIWKAELQYKNKNQLHYHITSDTYIPYKELRAKWNQLQKEAGYLDEYYEKRKHYNPNSTDVHSVRKIKNLAYYLKKEIVKDIQNGEDIGGKVWDCSLNIKAAGYFTLLDYGETTDNLTQAIKGNNVRYTKTDHCTIYDIRRGSIWNILSPEDQIAFKKHQQDIFNYERKPKEPPRTEYIPPKVIYFKPQINLFSSS